jgi:splicing factor 3A subunit 3
MTNTAIEEAIGSVLLKNDIASFHRSRFLIHRLVDKSKYLIHSDHSGSSNISRGQYIQEAKVAVPSKRFKKLIVDVHASYDMLMKFQELQKYSKENSAQIAWERKRQHYAKKESLPSDEYRDQFLASRKQSYKPMEYLDFLKKIKDLLESEIPRFLKYRVPEYLNFLSQLLSDLRHAFLLWNPLTDPSQTEDAWKREFNEKFKLRQIPGWESLSVELAYDWSRDIVLRITDDISNLNDPSPLTNNQKLLQKLKSEVHDKQLASLEFVCVKYYESLKITAIDKSIDEIQRRQSRIGQSSDDDDTSSLSDGDQEEKRNQFSLTQNTKDINNPLNLPIGFDGKPIPYWVYKLHGLDKEFPCEICGNEVYRGRRQYEKHFMESTHIEGLKKLRISDKFEYYNFIDKIEDALKFARHLYLQNTNRS